MYLFGYGSLINLESAQKSFKRELKQEDLIPVNVKGYDKVWNSIEHIEFNGININGVFLNLKKDESVITNGVLVKITDEELELLKLREKNYSCITIPASNADIKLDADMIAFMTTNEEKIAKQGDTTCFIPEKYIDLVTKPLQNYSEEFAKEYKKCLVDFPFPLMKGTYKFSDPTQNKFAKQGVKSSGSK